MINSSGFYGCTKCLQPGVSHNLLDKNGEETELAKRQGRDTFFLHHLWRAHECLSFILFYALPVFRDIISYACYENLKKLVFFVETIKEPEIDINHLNKMLTKLRNYIRQIL